MIDFEKFIEEEKTNIKNMQLKRINSVREELFEKYYQEKRSGEDVEEEERRNPDYIDKYYKRRFEEEKQLKKENRIDSLKIFFYGFIAFSLMAFLIFTMIMGVIKEIPK